MGNVTIRELKPADIPKLLDLTATRDELDLEGAKKRTELMEWCAFKNPYAGTEPTYFVADDDGKIVAHLGRMPTEFIVKGRPQRGYFVHDLYVHPQYREGGRGVFLSMSLYRAIEHRSDSFLCLVWTTDLNLSMQRKRGYYELKAGCYLKILNPKEILRRTLKRRILVATLSPFVKVGLDLLDFAILRLTPSRREIVEMDRFDSSFDDLYQSIRGKLGACSHKQSSYLNWKFIDRPSPDALVLAARHEGQLRGVLLLSRHLGKDYPEGKIIDVVADPHDRDTLISLLKAAILHFRRDGVLSIRCCATDQRLIRLLQRFLFLSLPRGEPVMLGKLETVEQGDSLKRIANWNLMYSESDETMLWPDQSASPPPG